VPLTIEEALTVENATVIVKKEVNMFLRIRMVNTKIKHNNNPT
jgi:hypothetical protein